MFQRGTNHRGVILCKFVWVVEAYQFFLVPSRSSNTPSYPSKVMWAREHAPTYYFFIVSSLDSHLGPSSSCERIKEFPNMSVKLYFVISKSVVTRAQLFWNIKYNIASGLFNITKRDIPTKMKATFEKHDLLGNSIKQKMLLESRALFWKQCHKKCLIEINNNEIKN
jgi:hypothetical protein